MMRRGLFVLLSAIILLPMFIGHAVGSTYGSFSGFPIVRITVNGQLIQGDVPAVILGNRTMVPLRFVSEALGAEVSWNQSTLTVGIASQGLSFVPDPHPPVSSHGSFTGLPIVRIVVDGNEVKGDVPGVILRNRTMVPLRFVSEALGADVSWDQATLTASVTSRGPSVGSAQHIILAPVHVTADWMSFSDMHGGWPGAIPNKDQYGVKFYEVAIWDDSLSVHLYAFPNDFDPSYGEMEKLPTEERVRYRENYCIMKYSGMPAEVSDRGPFILAAFTEFSRILVERHPDATHNLTYLGHGGSGGELFAQHMNRSQASLFLSHWTGMLGRKLGFIDMGMPCSKGSFQDLEIYHAYADYYIASDMAICGAIPDDESFDTMINDWLNNYPRLLSSYHPLEKALKARIDLRRLTLEEGRIARTADKNMQSLYLYSCEAFAQHKGAISAFMKSQQLAGRSPILDIKSIMIEYKAPPALINSLQDIIIYGVDNRDFFAWPEQWHGLSWCNFDYDH